MKRLLKKYMLYLSAIGILSVFAACSSEDDSVTGTTSQTREALQLTVSAGDFVTDGAPDTRAADNGNVTTFESGDRIGLIIVKESDKTLIADNVPYKYDGANWAFDAGNGDTKSVVYYDSSIGNVTYIAYFPYSKDADGATTIEQLKTKFVPKADQSSKADYRASDLMVWAPAASAPKKSLEIDLTHAYASVSLSPEVKYTLADGNNTPVFVLSSLLSDLNFTIGNDVFYPFQAEDGSFRCILPAGTSGTIRWFYTFEDKIYGSEYNLVGTANANIRYARHEIMRDGGTYSLDNARIGDFYCKNDNGEGYLVPGDIVSLPAAQKTDCIGIVFFSGKHETDDTDYSTTGILQKQCHGYAVALKDAGSFNWNRSNVIGTYNNNSDWNGYFNQTKIKDYAEKNENCEMSSYFPAANVCAGWGTDDTSPNSTAYKAPSGSSGWFLPSAGQLKAGLYDNKATIELALTKAAGETFASDRYWSSSENTSDYNPGYYAYAVDLSSGYLTSEHKAFSEFQVRAVLAF